MHLCCPKELNMKQIQFVRVGGGDETAGGCEEGRVWGEEVAAASKLMGSCVEFRANQ